jgi:glycosyltransferase involved in cell wall biosynthesis
MSEKGVLIDGSQFLSKIATGIGSYGRTLTRTLRTMGIPVTVLYGRSTHVSRHAPPQSLATQVFGSEALPEGRLTRVVRNAPFLARSLTGLIKPVRPDEVPTEGINLGAFEPPLPEVDHVLNASRVYDRAHLHFTLKERLLEVAPPPGIGLAHWTGPMALKARGVPNVYTLHDLIPLQFPYFIVDRGGLSSRLHAAIAREADHIITVSEASKHHIVDLLKIPEDRVSVTYQPVPSLAKLNQSEAARLVETIYGAEPGNYALFLGAIEPKKNLKRLIEAFLMADPGIPLLIAGPKGWLNKEDLELIETVSAHQTLVRQLGYLPRRHVTALLQCARFFAFPSIYEGFGLPVLEAMQLGVPVLTSSTSSLPEVAGDAAVLVDPLNINQLTAGIRALTNDPDLRNELSLRGPQQAAKFSDEVYRHRLGEAYKKVGIAMPQSVQQPSFVQSAGVSVPA